MSSDEIRDLEKAPLTRIIRRAEDNLPMMQKAIDMHDGRLPRVFTIEPGGYLAFFTGMIIESSRARAIDKFDIERLAAILHTTASDRFEFEVTDTIVGYACVVAFGWQSPKVLRGILRALEANPEATIAQYRDNQFVSLMIARLHDEAVCNLTGPFDDVQRQFRLAARRMCDQVRRLIPRGHGNDGPPALFFEHITRMARRYGCDLRLPNRDASRGGPATTALLEFANLMRALLITQARTLGVSPTNARFGKMERMTDVGTVIALERAKAAGRRKTL